MNTIFPKYIEKSKDEKLFDPKHTLINSSYNKHFLEENTLHLLVENGEWTLIQDIETTQNKRNI